MEASSPVQRAPALTSRRAALRAGRDYAGLALLAFALWLLLTHVNAFYSSILVSILIWTVATSGLNVIAGLGGYPSLVQAAFYGLGAYGSSLALAHGAPFWAAVLAALVLAGAAGLLIGLVFSRVRGQYFAIGTLFFGAVVALVLVNWTSLTQGALGLSVPFAFDSADELNAVIAACAGAALMLFRFVAAHRLGRRLLTVREDEDLAEHVGVPTGRTKLAGFVLSALVGGGAGVLIAQYNGTISPDLFAADVGFVMFVALSVGGAGRVLGPLLGCAFIVGIPDLLNLPSGIGLLLVGVVFVTVTLLIPGGLISALDAVTGVVATRGRR